MLPHFYVLSGLKDKCKLHSSEKAFLKLNTFAVNKNSFKESKYPGSIQNACSIFATCKKSLKIKQPLLSWYSELLEMRAAYYSLGCSTLQPWQQDSLSVQIYQVMSLPR